MRAQNLGQAFSAQDAERLRAHVSQCPACAERAAWDQAIRQGIRQMASPQPSADFNQRLRQRLERPAPARGFRLQWLPALGIALGAAALALALVLASEHIFRMAPVPASQVVLARTPGSIRPAAAVPTPQVMTAAPGNKTQSQASSQGVPRRAPLAPEIAKELQALRAEIKPAAAQPGNMIPQQPAVKVPVNQRPETSSAPSVFVSAPGSKTAAANHPAGLSAPQAAQTPLAGGARLLRNKINLNRGERTRLEFVLEKPSRISVKIYNREGKLVRDWFEGTLPGGLQFLEWDGTLENGRKISSGIYIVVLDGEFPECQFKLAVIK